MSKLSIPPTYYSPKVEFDPDKNHFEISGQSVPHDVHKTFNPILEWVEKHLEQANMPFILNFKMDYFNSSTARIFSQLFESMERFMKKGKTVEVNWFYAAGDEDIKNAGEIFADYLSFPFNLIAKNTED